MIGIVCYILGGGGALFFVVAVVVWGFFFWSFCVFVCLFVVSFFKVVLYTCAMSHCFSKNCYCIHVPWLTIILEKSCVAYMCNV